MSVRIEWADGVGDWRVALDDADRPADTSLSGRALHGRLSSESGIAGGDLSVGAAGLDASRDGDAPSASLVPASWAQAGLPIDAAAQRTAVPAASYESQSAASLLPREAVHLARIAAGSGIAAMPESAARLAPAPQDANVAPVIGGTSTTAPVVSIVRTSTSAAGVQTDRDSAVFAAVISPDGTKVAFESIATNLAAGSPNSPTPTNYLKDLATGAVTLLSTGAIAGGPVFSPDGTKIAFGSAAAGLVAGDTNNTPDIFIRDIASGTVTRVSTTALGAQANNASIEFAFSADGTKIAFRSLASNLVAGDTNGQYDVFVKDLNSGAVTRVSTASDGTQANGMSAFAFFSPDGTKVAFRSLASNLVAGDTNGVSDVFIKDLNSGVLTRVSTDGAGGQLDGGSFLSSFGVFSPDGGKLLFQSHATVLAADNPTGLDQIYIKDLVSGAVTLVSSDAGGSIGNSDSFQAQFSSDGSKVVFYSAASNLVAGDSNGAVDVFTKDLSTGTVTRLAAPGTQTDHDSLSPQYAADGSKIVFTSYATDLIASDTNDTGDVFVASLGYVAQAAPIAIASGLALSDGDSAALAGATVTISSGFQTGDVLSAATAGTAITASFDSDSHVLTLSGSDTLAHYQSVLRSVSFSNPGNADAGAAAARTFTWQADDGAATNHAGNAPTTTINVFDFVNSVHAGSVAIGGTLAEGQTVTADISGLSDADGLGTLHYQWQDVGTDINGAITFVDNVGADQATYDLSGSDIGAHLRVVVSYTDGHGTAETAYSALTAPVADIPDNPPTGVLTIDGTPAENQVLTANTSALADADGLGDFTILWLRDGVALVATAPTYTPGNADVGHTITAVATYVDGLGTFEEVYSAATPLIANVNDPPSGQVIVSGVAAENQTLTADISQLSDADGIGAGGKHYQWQRDSGSGFVNVGADLVTYTLGNADVGAQMRVVVFYTDLHGTAEHLASAATGPIQNINDAPSGAVAITGTATFNQPLAADTATIADADGLGAFHYQWQHSSGGGFVNVGTDAASFTPHAADIGTQIRVIVSYTDAHGTLESLTSGATATVSGGNSAPTGGVAILGGATEDHMLTASTASLSDADGIGTLHYQWQRAFSGSFADIGTDQATYTPGDADVGSQLRVVVTYTDGGGTAELLNSALTAPIANVNDAPTGGVVIGGSVMEDQTLLASTISLADADGLGPLHYQWQRDSGGGYLNVGADQTTYLLGDADVGGKMRVVVSYTDGFGTHEKVTSAATAAVANVNDEPTGTLAVYGTGGLTFFADTTAISDADGLGTLTYTWFDEHFGPGFNTTISDLPLHTLVDGDYSGMFGLRISYTDGHGTDQVIDRFNFISIGSAGNDFLFANGDNNGGNGGAIVGGAGDDYLVGTGAGVNALYSGSRSDYHVTYDTGAQRLIVADQRAGSPDGTDTLENILTVTFTDGTFTYDTSGHITSNTIYDTALTAPWMLQTTYFDAQGSVAAQIIRGDGGGRWANSYDTNNGASWLWQTDNYDAHGNLVTEVVTKDDGTHSLQFNDVANAYRWTTAIVSFDANWNQTGITGTNDDATHTITMRDIAAAYDTLPWFAAPYDANLGGPAVNTVLTGGGNVDYLQTYAGNDTLSGGGGNDFLIGGTGNDTLTGGAGDDRFIFHNGDGVDVVTDFVAGNASGDVVELHAYGIASFAALQPFLSQVGADVVIAFDPDNQITLQHVTLAQLNAADFAFA